MKLFRALNRWRWFVRWPVKGAVVALVLIVVCFPHPVLMVRHLQRWRNPNVLIDPNDPGLEPLIAAVRAVAADDGDGDATAGLGVDFDADGNTNVATNVDAGADADVGVDIGTVVGTDIGADADVDTDSDLEGDAAVDTVAAADGATDAEQVLARVQRVVDDRLPYAWDWENWGNADYIPTVREALDAGREDCDGRAVVAASLLKRLGFDARIVTDFAHVWVQTDRGETMNPGDREAVVAEDGGLSVRPGSLGLLVQAGSYGLAVFYLHRELIVLAALWIMMIRPGRSWARNGLALTVLVVGLWLARLGGRHWQDAWGSIAWAGPACLILAAVLASAWRQPSADKVSE